ncbi:MAG: DUF2256 and DUF3253 domain-containing protein [Planctomycetota bacterium]
MSTPAPKTCVVCGRTMTWRRAWARNWEHVKCCSSRCRKRGLRDIDRASEQAIVAILNERARQASICPSEVARRVKPDDWRSALETVRMAARRLVDAGLIEITQRGRVVDPSTARGPIRIRKSHAISH